MFVEILLGILILAVAGLAVAVLAHMKRQGGGAAEQQLRAEAAGQGAKAEELRGQVARLEARSRELEEQLSGEIGGRRAAEASLAAERQNLADQRALLDEAELKLKDAFAALSADALKTSRNEFITQADQKLKPIQDLIATYEQHLREIEKTRSAAYGSLEQHLRALTQDQQLLRAEAGKLTTALRSPTVRGRWGEVTLRRVVEVAGMSKFCDFEEQVSVAGEDALQRPDMIVKLPNHRTIVVDSKVPLEAYLQAIEATDEPPRQEAFARHAQAVRSRMKALGQQSYWRQFQPAPDFVVLFLPGESFFSAALEQDRDLIEDGMKSGVVLATPTTLIALLRAVAYGWRQEEVAENAQRIAEAGQELYDRLCKFVEHFARVGDGLSKAAKAYDAAAGSYEARIQPAARRLAEQASVTDKELPEVPHVEGPSRPLAPPALEAPDDPALAQPRN